MNIGHKIKRTRLTRGLTLEKLAQSSGLTKGYLSKLERSAEPPPVSTLQSIAIALGIDIADFFEDASKDTLPNLEITRSQSVSEEFTSGSGYSYHPLVKRFRNKYMSPFLMTIGPGETETFAHDSEEFCYVLDGPVEFCYDGGRYTLDTGDGFYFDSRKPHYFANSSDKTATVIAVNFNYRRF